MLESSYFCESVNDMLAFSETQIFNSIKIIKDGSFCNDQLMIQVDKLALTSSYIIVDVRDMVSVIKYPGQE